MYRGAPKHEPVPKIQRRQRLGKKTEGPAEPYAQGSNRTVKVTMVTGKGNTLDRRISNLWLQ